MRQRPKKQEEPIGGEDDLGALICRNGGFGFPVTDSLDPRRAAKFLYWSCWRPCDIAELLGLPEATVASWKRRDGWDVASTRLGG